MLCVPMFWLSMVFLMVGVGLTLSSVSIFSIWLGVELNMVGFLLFMFLTKKTEPQNVLAYFIVQAFSTLLFLVGGLMKLDNSTLTSSLFLSFALLLKAGLPPGHFWFIRLFQTLEISSMILLSTIQKLIPLFLLGSCHPKSLSCISLIFLPLIGLAACSNLRLSAILGFSSVFGGLWGLMVSETFELVGLFLSVYCLGMAGVLCLSPFKEAISAEASKTLFNKIVLIISFLSLAGFPPLMGFFVKICLFVQMMMTNMVVEGTSLLILSPLFLSAYMGFMVGSLKGAGMVSTAGKFSSLNFNSGLGIISVLLLGLPLWVLL